jgi:ketosteroid isomerase-like protein
MTNARDRKGIAITKHRDAIAHNKAVIRPYYERAERGDISEFAKCLHPEFFVEHATLFLNEWRHTQILGEQQ